MSSHGCRQGRLQTVTTGALFVMTGIVVWAGARGWYSVRDAWVWWPVVFVFPAAQALTAPPPARSLFRGLAWLGAAAVLVAANMGRIHLGFDEALAVALVVGGARLVYLSWTRGRTA